MHDKPALEIDEQIIKLKKRRLKFKNDDEVREFLLKTNYYRLSGYWRKYQKNPNRKPKRKKDNYFIHGTTFEQIKNIYKLDVQLRNLLLKGIEIFEVCFRTRFAYEMATSDKENGKFLYLNETSYNNIAKSTKNKKKSLVETIFDEIDRSGEKFIEHYRGLNQEDNKWVKKVPIWVAVEVLSFGTISKMYSCWKDKEVVKDVSKYFETFRNYDESRNMIRTLVDLRNLCAHHSRLWNRALLAQITKKNPLTKNDYADRALLTAINLLTTLVDEIEPEENYSQQMIALYGQKYDGKEEFKEGLINPTL